MYVVVLGRCDADIHVEKNNDRRNTKKNERSGSVILVCHNPRRGNQSERSPERPSGIEKDVRQQQRNCSTPTS